MHIQQIPLGNHVYYFLIGIVDFKESDSIMQPLFVKLNKVGTGLLTCQGIAQVIDTDTD